MDAGSGLTHEEIWDDSMLVDSWNQALEEYKKYHSIHKKGGKLPVEEEDLEEGEIDSEGGEKDAEGQQQQKSTELEPPADGTRPDAKTETNDRDQAMEEEGPEPAAETITGGGGALEGTDVGLGRAAGQQQGHAHVAIEPQAVLGTVQDEGLKKLLMSWYYAGYYTGLYEGQQQAQQQSRPEK